MDRTLSVQRRLLRWFEGHRRDLPWRRTHHPYRILVSEVMLQQTQVSRVVPKYHAFLQQFPTLRALARAQQRSVVAAWAGLGYNRRARHLHQLAKIVQHDYAGKFPRSARALRQLPGVGDYTAAAVMCFAYGAPVALVDVNVRRVLGRVFYGVHGPARVTNDRMWQLAASLVPARRAVAWNSMLMDFGATVCTQRKPLCASCPVRDSCSAYPAILRQRGPAAGSAERFVGSNRYWRGKVVDFLRLQPHHRALATTLQRVFAELGLQGHAYSQMLASLAHDQLISVRGRTVRL